MTTRRALLRTLATLPAAALGVARGASLSPVSLPALPLSERRLANAGLFDGEHFFELERLPSGATRLTNREEYRGVLSLVIGRLPMMKSAPAGFEKLNVELKRHIEAAR